MGMEGDRSLVAGRSQREKRRSYKDLLREEEEIAAQVRKSSKKRLKVRAQHLGHCSSGISGNLDFTDEGVLFGWKQLNCVIKTKFSCFKPGFGALHARRGFAQEEEKT